MKIAAAFISCLALASAAVVKRDVQPKVEEACYENYGCFTTEAPWTSWLRPLAGLPNPPWGVGTRFLLFTRTNQYADFEIVPDNEHILADSPYDATKETVFLIHGFTESHVEPWMVNARNALLAKEDINIISVDWSPGASRSYLRATNNVRMVGAQLIRMLDFLVEKTNLDLGTVRIVAHSIGAHAASYAGEHYWGAIGHITALDPSGPYFDGGDALIRIDKSDATHVQVIHTNGDPLGGMGIRAALGHVDIYVNGGNQQPGCDDLLGGIIGAIINLILWEFDEPFGPLVCSHNRAAEYYVESILSSCPFVAHKCSNADDYNDGHCHSDCSMPGFCTVLGYAEENYSSARGTFYVNTDENKAFCMQSVQFDTSVQYNQDSTEGKVTVEFRYGSERFKHTVVDGDISGGQILTKWVDIPSQVLEHPAEDTPTLYIRYTRDGMFGERYLELDEITVSVLNERFELHRVHFRATRLETGVDAILYPQ